MLTARDSLPDIIVGLDSGADDYLTKPFSFTEMLTRIRALGRRGGTTAKHVLEVHDLVLDVSSCRTFRGGQLLCQSWTEFGLLEVLARNQGRVVSPRALLAAVWGNRREVEENTLDAFVRLIREKVDRESDLKLIHTHRGLGYSISARPAYRRDHPLETHGTVLRCVGRVLWHLCLDERCRVPPKHGSNREGFLQRLARYDNRDGPNFCVRQRFFGFVGKFATS